MQIFESKTTHGFVRQPLSSSSRVCLCAMNLRIASVGNSVSSGFQVPICAKSCQMDIEIQLIGMLIMTQGISAMILTLSVGLISVVNEQICCRANL